MFSIRPVLVLALVPFLLQPRAEEFAPRHEKGAVLVRTFESTGSFELDEVMMEIAGEEHSPDEVPEFTIDMLERVVVTDEIETVEGGQVRKLRRTYGELVERNSFESPEDSSVRERESELADEAVAFTWDADAEEWKKKAENEELDGALLEGLRADLSFAEFLPSGEVAEGDTWEVPVEAFALIFAPAGELSFAGEDEEDPADRARISRELLENISGTITAKYAGKRDEDGVEVAVIELEMEIESEAVLNSSDEGTQNLELGRDLEGELLWLVAEGRMHSLHADGDGDETLASEGSFETPDGNKIEIVQRQTFRGTRSYRFSVEKR